jgi:REP element-mobilizing transposase RayT
MSQSLSATYMHLVFSTKHRHPWLTDAIIRSELHQYLGGVSKTLDCPTLIVGGVEDHVHLLARFGRMITQADWIKELKRITSIWVKGKSEKYSEFAWQGGYGIFSVSVSNIDAVKQYIANQEEHYKKTSFQDELRALFTKHQLEWDERYVWD